MDPSIHLIVCYRSYIEMLHFATMKRLNQIIQRKNILKIVSDRMVVASWIASQLNQSTNILEKILQTFRQRSVL